MVCNSHKSRKYLAIIFLGLLISNIIIFKFYLELFFERIKSAASKLLSTR